MKAKPYPEQGFRACLGILRSPAVTARHALRQPADAAMISARPPTARSNQSTIALEIALS